MVLSIQPAGQASEGAGFDRPLALLVECHRRVAQQCATLQRLRVHLLTHGCDADAAQAAAAVMRYFDQAAPKHHADEELDLIPALMAQTQGDEALALGHLVADLMADHQVLEQQWQVLRASLHRLAAGQPATLDGVCVDAFIDRYAAHIQREETELLPLARRRLSTESLQRMGEAMRQRREPAAGGNRGDRSG